MKRYLKHFLLCGFLFVFLSASCDEQKNKNATVPSGANEQPPKTNLPPVEKEAPNTDYKPAFEGQTRIEGVKTETPYEAIILNRDLKKPWGINTLPDGRLIITEKAGTLRIATKDGKLSEPINGFPAVDDRNQGGLLDVAPSPEFSNNRLLYFTLAEKTSQGSLTAVGKGRLADNEKQIENFEIIYRALPYFDNSMHFGSRIVFDKKGNIFVSTGERSDLATRPNAQLLNTGHGKIVYITKDGKGVEGNPFENQNNSLPEIYTYGHRNVQGLALHPQTGELWASEMGPRGGDELNLIEAGKNYGWPIITYGIEYSGKTIGEGITQKEEMVQPVYYWDPVLSPSGMTFYSGNEIPEWENNLFIGGLSSKHIARLIIEEKKVIGEERLLESENQRFRDITDGKDGALYAITDEGRLYKITRK